MKSCVQNVVAVVFVLLALTNCTGLYTQPPEQPHVIPQSRASGQRDHRIHVYSDGWHTGIVISSSDAEDISWLHGLDGGGKYIELGWGDEALIRSSEMSLGLVLSALFIPTPTVVKVEWFTESPFKRYEGMQFRTYDITEEQFQLMMGEMLTSIKENSGKLSYLGKGEEPNTVYYRGKNKYRIGRSCNRWSARALRSAGFSVYAIFSPSVFRDLDKHHKQVE